jgi:hypothetical protein
MTADEANAYFAGMGYEPVYNEQEIPAPMEVPNAITKMTVMGIDWSESNLTIGDQESSIKMPIIKMETSSEALEPTEAEGGPHLVSFSGKKTPPPIKGFRKLASGSSNNYSSKNSGGGSPKKSSGGGGSKGSSPKSSKPKKSQKTDVKDLDEAVTRYKNTDNLLESIERKLNKVQSKKD